MKTAERPQSLFDFALAPLADVMPWGVPAAPSLHWFGLTQGQYWIAAGQDTLLEYSAGEMARSGLPRFCDYYIVRFHEDLLDMLPAILEPVPGDLAPCLERAARDALYAWEPEAEEAWDTRQLALSWISERTLDLGYLSSAADIRLWSDLSAVHIAWDNRGILSGGVPTWGARAGSIALERPKFEAEVRSLHTRLIAQMAERVDAVVGGALDPGIAIALEELVREQEQRGRALEVALARPSPSTDWDRVRQAIATAQAHCSGASADPYN